MALQLHWKFDETSGTTAADSSGNSRSGTVNGTSFTTGAVTGAGGTLGGGLLLDGVNDYISRSATAFNGYTAFSFSLWTKKTTSGFTNSDIHGFSAGVWGGAGSVFFEPHEVWPGGGSGGGTAFRFDNTWFSYSDPSWTTSDWHHFAITYDGTNVRIYRDAVLKYTSSTLSGKSLSLSGWDLHVGAMVGFGRYYPGTIDDFRIYDHALTGSEVTDLFNLASSGGGISGDLASTETGSDTVSISGQVLIAGSIASQESGSDTVSIAGQVLVSGSLASQESGSDVAAITGQVLISGVLATTEVGSDVVSIISSSSLNGTLDATEVGSDTVSITGQVLISGVLASTESGSDVVVITGTVSGGGPPPEIVGTLAAVEQGSDVVAISGQVLISGTMNAVEVGSDVVAIYSTVPAVAFQMLTHCKSRTLQHCKSRVLEGSK